MARWVDHDGQERSQSFDRKTEAQRHVTTVTSALTTGTYADPQRSSVTFGAIAEEWYASKATLAPKTVGGYRGLLDNIILPKWREVALREIDHAAMQSWVTWLSTNPAARQRAKGKGGLSPARVIQAHQVVHQVLAYAIRAKYIAANPADSMQLPRKTSAEKIALTHDQVRKLAEASGEVSTMVYTLAYAGLRYGECAALRVGDVDVARRRLRVSRSITGVRKMGQVEGGTKTHATREAPIPQFVADLLKDVVGKRDPSEYLFARPNGGHMTIGAFRVGFNKACTELKITNVSPHTLRHTAGSLALASGASVVTVSKLLGHRNVTTTMNVYMHQLPDDFDDLAAAMDKAARAAAD